MTKNKASDAVEWDEQDGAQREDAATDPGRDHQGLAAPYEPKKRESEALAKLDEKLEKKGPIASLSLDHDEEARRTVVGFDHPDQKTAAMLAMSYCGTADVGFFNGLIKHIASATNSGKDVSEDAANFMLSVIRCVEPQDEVEAMLAAQMAATHELTMVSARRLAQAEHPHARDSAERAYNKLARTYTTQMEALKRYRSKAQQTVRVERVSVTDGGQAIVGNVNHGGGADGEK